MVVTVLVIDDNAVIRRWLATSLARDGYNVITACDGEEALHFLEEILPAVIFVDIHMPNMDGPTFRQAQRRDRRWLSIPTIVMTGTDEEALLDLAVDETLRKPIHPRDLRAIMERHTSSRATLHE